MHEVIEQCKVNLMYMKKETLQYKQSVNLGQGILKGYKKTILTVSNQITIKKTIIHISTHKQYLKVAKDNSDKTVNNNSNNYNLTSANKNNNNNR